MPFARKIPPTAKKTKTQVCHSFRNQITAPTTMAGITQLANIQGKLSKEDGGPNATCGQTFKIPNNRTVSRNGVLLR